MLALRPEQAFLRRRQRVAVTAMPGFVRGRHRVPSETGRAGDQFVHALAAEQIAAEVRGVYDGAKRVLGLRRRDLARAVAEGGGNVDAPQFRFSIDLGLDRLDPRQVLWQRRVVLLVGPTALPGDFDRLFPVACDELVIPLAEPARPVGNEFDQVVERLEDFAERYHAVVDEDETHGCATLQTGDGSRIALDLHARELSLQMLGHDGCLDLLLEAQRRFVDLAGPIVAALEQG